MIADYFLVRKTRLEVDDLYRRNGAYEYRNGVNWRAMVALGAGIAVALCGLFIPAPAGSTTTPGSSVLPWRALLITGACVEEAADRHRHRFGRRGRVDHGAAFAGCAGGRDHGSGRECRGRLRASRMPCTRCELCNSDVPVYRGAKKPLRRTLETAHWFHGLDGLGDHGFRPQRRSAETRRCRGRDYSRVVEENPGLEIITLGPLTNLALALRRSPEWKRQRFATGGDGRRALLRRQRHACSRVQHLGRS